MTVLFWLIFSILAGWLGSKKKIGFGWVFLISLILSPLVGFIVALISDKKE